MKNLALVTIVACMFSLPNIAFAGFWTGPVKLVKVKATNDGTAIQVDSTWNPPSENGFTCPPNDANRKWFFLPKEDVNNFNTKTSLILSSFISGKKIQFAIKECIGLDYKIDSVELLNL